MSNIGAALSVMALEFFSHQHRNAIPLETPIERDTRVEMISEESVEACRLEPIANYPLGACAALVLTLAEWESALYLPIHAGLIKGKSGELGLGQVHRTVVLIPDPKFRVTRSEWENIPGTDAEHTLGALRITARIFGWHAKRCHIRWHGADDLRGPAVLFTQYHQPRNAVWSHGQPICLGSPAPTVAYRPTMFLRKVKRLENEGISLNDPPPKPAEKFSLSQSIGHFLTHLSDTEIDSSRVKELPSLPLDPPGRKGENSTVPGLLNDDLFLAMPRIVTGNPDPALIETVSEILERARSGEIASFLGIVVNKDGRVSSALHTRSSELPRLHYTLSHVQANLLQLGEENTQRARG